MEISKRVTQKVQLESKKIDIEKEISSVRDGDCTEVKTIVYPLKKEGEKEYFLLLEFERKEKDEKKKEEEKSSISKKKFSKPTFSNPLNFSKNEGDELFKSTNNNSNRSRSYDCKLTGSLILSDLGDFYLLKDTKKDLTDRKEYLEFLTLKDGFPLRELDNNDIQLNEVNLEEMNMNSEELDYLFYKENVEIQLKYIFESRSKLDIIGIVIDDGFAVIKLSNDQTLFYKKGLKKEKSTKQLLLKIINEYYSEEIELNKFEMYFSEKHPNELT